VFEAIFERGLGAHLSPSTWCANGFLECPMGRGADLKAGRGGAGRLAVWSGERGGDIRDGDGVPALALSWLRRASGVGRIAHAPMRSRRGVTDRGEFGVVDCSKLPAEEIRLHLVLRRDSRFGRSGGLAMKSIRGALKPDGAYLMVEMNVSARPRRTSTRSGRMMYAASTLYCMTVVARARVWARASAH